TLERSFTAVAGADEYAVKLFAVAAAPAMAAASSGSDYLKRKAEAMRAKTTRSITPQVEEFISALHRLARDAAEGGRVGAGQKNLLWHRSLLVARERRPQLEQRLQEFSSRWGAQYRVECTGPWPPYSFLKVESEK
ncbi:MAG TPA: GvpL/GvpF family gas vesicle protein, partial [Terriglobales bacterium]|nr:GvpL/GvpF family gas vesicle protein [Terriglobales bacterium]